MIRESTQNWHLTDARREDIPSAVESLVLAFDRDPHMAFFFPGEPPERRRHISEFFGILVGVRLALGMPVTVLKSNGRAMGIVMGHSTARPPWPAEWQERWEALQASCDGCTGRFEQSDAASAQFEPPGPHYYLGAVGLHPSLHGLGAGARLVESFCTVADNDYLSRGTFIETCNPTNVKFYQRCGFALSGQQSLNLGTTLFCLFRQKAA